MGTTKQDSPTPQPLERLRDLATTPGYRRSQALRRTAAALLITAAVASALIDRAGADPGVVVFTRDVAAGETLTSGDVTIQRLPEEVTPAGALGSLGEVEEQVVASAAAAGEVVTSTRLLGPDLVSSLVAARAASDSGAGAADPSSYTLVPVKLAEPDIIPMLRHGDEVSVVTPDPGSDHHDESATPAAQTIATGGTVVIAGSEHGNDSGGGGNSGSGGQSIGSHSGGVLLLLRNDDATSVAAASLTSPLALVLTGRTISPEQVSEHHAG